MDRSARLLGCLLALALACEPSHPLHGETQCTKACDRWRAMGCEEAEPVCDRYQEPVMVCEQWITCVEWCVQVEAKLNLPCIIGARVETCDALERACLR